MSSSTLNNLLVVSFNPKTLLINEIVSGDSDPKMNIVTSETLMTDLFALKKRDVAFISEHLSSFSIMQTIARYDNDSSYLLSMKCFSMDDSIICTIIPQTILSPRNQIAEKLLNEIENGNHDIFTPHLPSALLILDNDSFIQAANQEMFDMFELNVANISGTNFGNVFRCSAASTIKQKCGSFSHCRNCNLRNGITEVLEKRLPVLQVETDFEYVTETGSENMRLNITATEIEFMNFTFVAVLFIRIS